MLSDNLSVQYLGLGFPNGSLIVPHPAGGPSVMLHHVLDGGAERPPFRFGFTEDFGTAVYTGPNELPQAVLEQVLPALRQGAYLESQGKGPQHYRVQP